jgi:uncharacterized membrane protein YphA (DoxX/SURF4 family)
MCLSLQQHIVCLLLLIILLSQVAAVVAVGVLVVAVLAVCEVRLQQQAVVAHLNQHYQYCLAHQ